MRDKNKSVLCIISSAICLGLISVLFGTLPQSLISSTNAQNIYSFNFNSGSNVLDFNKNQVTATTLDGNSIYFSYNGLLQSNGCVAEFTENSSFYNPKLDVENSNKISGINGIKAIYNGTNKLTLSYGWLSGDEYEFANHLLESNVLYDFGTYLPSFFRISNLNEESINLLSLTISYTCLEQQPHVHDWGNENVISHAECDHTGLSEVTCLECGETKQIITPAMSKDGEHTFEDYIISKEPTCVEDGLKYHICSVCGHYEEEIIPATGVHAYGEWIIDSEPTFFEPGEKHRVCSVCGHTEYEEIEQLIAAYQITANLYGDNVDVIDVDESGAYSLVDPSREGYTFVKWVDQNDNDFESEGVISESKTIYAVWEIDGTDTFAKLKQRAINGVDFIKLTEDIAINETIFVKGNVTIYSDDNVKLTRSPSFDGDLFVVGENTDGSNPIIDGEVPPTLNLGLDGSLGSITIDGNKDNLMIDVKGSALFVNNSGTVNIFDSVSVVNNNKTGNERVLNYNDSLFYQRLGGAGALILNGTLNMYGGEFSNNTVNLTDLSKTDELIPSYYASYGGAIAAVSNFNMYGGSINNNQGARGGALYLGGINNIVAGAISNNKAFGVGGAIYAHNSDGTELCLGSVSAESTFALNFIDNESTGNGGSIYTMEQVNFHIFGHTLFQGNYSNSNGGAIFSASRLVMDSENANSISFINNSARSNGGACYFTFDAGDGEEPVERFTIRLVKTTFDSNSANNGGAIYSVGANLYLNNLSFVNNNATSIGGAIYGVSNEDGVETKLYVSVVTFTSNSANEGGAVFLDKNCIFESSSQCYFYTNTSTNNGGAISSHGGLIRINLNSIKHGIFKDNTAGGNGGAIYLSYRSNSGENPDPIGWDSSATLTNVSFQSNEAVLGGAIYATTKINGSNVLSTTGCSFTSNSSSGGAAAYIIGATISLSNTTFSSNSSNGNGGAMVLSNSTATLTSCSFLSNTSTNKGGAVYSSTSSIISNLCIYSDNESGSQAALALSNSLLTSTNDIYENNVNRALYLDSSSANISDAIFTNNNTSGNGGAINVADSSSSLDIINSTFESNSADGNAGAIMITAGDVHVESSSFASNVSHSETYGGGAIYSTGSTVEIQDSIFEHNSATNGGAIAIYSNSQLTISGIEAYENSATNHGGFIYIRNSNVYTKENANNSIIGAENRANTAQYGGAVSISVSSSNWSSSTTLDSFNLSYNESTVAGGAIYVNGASTELYISNSALNHNSSNNGGALYFDSETEVNLDDCTVEYNNADNNGGAIYVIPSFDSNDAVTGHATITINNSSFNHNQSGNEGGVIYTRETVEISITSSSFNNNSSTTTGGVISSHGSICSIHNSVFNNNSAGTNGGALYLSYISNGSYDSNFTITSSTFEENSANYGGVIYLTSKVQYQGICEITSSTFANNSSTSNGGVILASYSTVVINGTLLDKTVFNGNSSITANGGAIYASSSSVNIEYSEFNNNVSAKSGGAVYLTSCDNALINHSSLNGNQSSTTGGAVYLSNSSLSSTQSNYVSNVSDANGGAIYLTSSSLNLNGTSFIGNSSTNGSGGAIAEHTNSSIMINGITAYDNSALNGEGGFALIKNSTLSTVENPDMSYFGALVDNVKHGNTAQVGGAISLSGGSGQSINLENVSICYNSATLGNGGAISLTDLSIAELTNCVLAENTSPLNGGAIYNYGATVYLTDSVLSNNSADGNGGAISCEQSESKSKPILNIVNCTFDSNNSTNGGAIYADYTTLSFASGTLTNNSATSNGGAIYVRYSTVTIYSMTATKNTASSGGVFYVNRTSININEDGDGTVIFGADNESNHENGNSASSGGVFYATVGSDIKINNSIFGFNTASYGGAITATHDSGNQIVISNSRFISNVSTGTSYGGGAIYAVGQSRLTIENCTFVSNSAKNGGAIYANSSAPISISGSTFENNVSTTGGGAVYITGGTVITISDSSFVANQAKNGGAIFMNGTSSTTISDSFINENIATTYGGGVYINETASLSVVNSIFNSNIATSNGGGAYLYTTGTTVLFNECTFESNVSESGNGGAFYAANSCEVTLVNVIGTNNSASNGYGGFAGVTSNVVLNLKGLTLSGNTAKTGANLRINNSSVTVNVNKSYSYSLNGSILSTEAKIKTMFSLASGTVINYETNQ